VQKDVLGASSRAVEHLQQAGAELVSVTSAQSIRGPASAAPMAEAAAFHEEWLREHPSDYDPRSGGAAIGEHRVGSSTPSGSSAPGPVLLVEMRAAFERVDVVVTPALPMSATPIGEREIDIGGPRWPLNPQMIRFSLPSNQTGCPAASL
jgi:aspartyl-tRNA(Asn)/glutamyl-tRNA(Gln) amidotransferase subunit A